MPTIINLKEAIQNLLEAEFASVLPNGINILTGEAEINISEVYSETAANVPCIVFDIVSTDPLTKDDPTTGCFKSTILIYVITHHSVGTTYITDKVSLYFTQPEPITNRNWFRDISTDCLINKYTKYIRRFSTNPKNNYKTDTYGEVVEIEAIWCPCSCDGFICDDELEDECPIDLGETQYDIDDDCC